MISATTSPSPTSIRGRRRRTAAAVGANAINRCRLRVTESRRQARDGWTPVLCPGHVRTTGKRRNWPFVHIDGEAGHGDPFSRKSLAHSVPPSDGPRALLARLL